MRVRSRGAVGGRSWGGWRSIKNRETDLHLRCHLRLLPSTIFHGVTGNLYLLPHIFLYFPSHLQRAYIIGKEKNNYVTKWSKSPPSRERTQQALPELIGYQFGAMYGLLPNSAFWVSHKICLSWTQRFQITRMEQGSWLRQGIKSYSQELGKNGRDRS